MKFQIRIQPSERLALRDPVDTALGRNIVRQGLILMHKLGFEHFTFKKLAEEMNTTEASVYRYFENKHRLLLYILNWYWSYLEYLVMFSLQNMTDPRMRIRRVIELLVRELPPELDNSGYDKKALFEIVVSESSKAYLTREVEEINKVKLFKPYKDLCGRIAGLLSAYNPAYPYPHSLSSTLIEMAHYQYFFMMHLPSLTDFQENKRIENIIDFLEHLVFSSLEKESE
ncbi:MAG: TetR/AcrR family transcriptional regulator [Saprospiraceae bacterium]